MAPPFWYTASLGWHLAPNQRFSQRFNPVIICHQKTFMWLKMHNNLLQLELCHRKIPLRELEAGFKMDRFAVAE